MLPSSLAVIGCGAISEEYYLPALLRLPRSSERVWLVDPSQRRLDEVVRKFGFASRQAVRSIGELPKLVSVGFNATPSHLHLESSLDLIQRKINVFLEKPLAETGKDAHQIVGAAQDRVSYPRTNFDVASRPTSLSKISSSRANSATSARSSGLRATSSTGRPNQAFTSAGHGLKTNPGACC